MRKPVVKVLLFTLLSACPFLLCAQEIGIDRPNDQPIEERIVYNHQNTLNIAIHSQGFGAGFKIGRIKNIHTTCNWETEFVSLHSLKEIKLFSGYATVAARPYVYGKLNNVFVVRFGYGQEKQIYGKPYWGGIDVRWIYEAGASLAILKPYYYYVVVYDPTNPSSTGIIEERRFDDPSTWMEIIGKASLSKGLNELSFSPGIHAKGGLSFDFSSSRTRCQAINIGLVAECFPMGISIIDSQRDRRLFLTFFISYNWGSKFNK